MGIRLGDKIGKWKNEWFYIAGVPDNPQTKALNKRSSLPMCKAVEGQKRLK